MKKKDSEKFTHLVNTKTIYDDLNKYAEYRIEELKDRLLYCPTWEDVKAIRGAIEELNRIKTLRDEVNNPRD
jgi:hypothetical protein